MLLEVRNLSTHFRNRRGVIRAVDDISYDLDEGETLAIAGESGCGKTVGALSLLRLIPDPPGRIAGGRILFEGRDILQMCDREMCDLRGNRISMIFQEPMTALHPVLTIGRQIMEPLIRHRNMSRKAAKEECIRLLKKVRIPDAEKRIHSYPHQFSGGMAQRVVIAMALACSPRLIIADEPTTAVDVTTQAELLEFMKGLTLQGTSLVIITHNLGIVARYADRVIIMYAGRIIERAATADLYRKPRHPYTRGLLASVPRIDRGAGQKLSAIEGYPPDLADLPPGCAFHPRCRHAEAICKEQAPVLRQVSDNHDVACWKDTDGK